MKRFLALIVTISILEVAVFPHLCIATDENSQFEQVGYFKTKKMRGFTFYVKNPTSKSIKSFCVKMKDRYQEGKNRILKIHFFDNKANTPDVTLKYYFPESSDKYLIADYWNNPFNGKSRLTFHKKIK